MQRYTADVHSGVKFSGLALQIASGHTGVWSNITGNRASGLASGLSPWDKVVLTVSASPSYCHRHPMITPEDDEGVVALCAAAVAAAMEDENLCTSA